MINNHYKKNLKVYLAVVGIAINRKKQANKIRYYLQK